MTRSSSSCANTLGLPMRREHALQRAQRDRDLLRREQALHDDGIAGRGAVQERARGQLLLGVERPRARPRLRLRIDTVAQVTSDAIARDAELARDSFSTPTERSQRSQVRHDLRIHHRDRERRPLVSCCLIHRLPFGAEGSVLVARGGQFTWRLTGPSPCSRDRPARGRRRASSLPVRVMSNLSARSVIEASPRPRRCRTPRCLGTCKCIHGSNLLPRTGAMPAGPPASSQGVAS